MKSASALLALGLTGCCCFYPPPPHVHHHPHHTHVHSTPKPKAQGTAQGQPKTIYRCEQCKATSETPMKCHGKDMGRTP